MPSIHTVRAGDLRDSEWEAWARIQRSYPEYRSPFFHPGFFRLLARVRPGLEVAVVAENGVPQGFLPFHRMPRGIGLPGGLHLADYHGGVFTPGTFPAAETLLEGAKLSAYDFHFWPEETLPAAARAEGHGTSWMIGLRQDYAAHWSKRMRANLAYGERKLAAREGALELEFQTKELRFLEMLLEWKRRQYVKSGVGDAMGEEWVRLFLRELFLHPGEDFGGVLSVLRAGEKVVALHFGLRARGVLHYWFPVYDPDYARFSPGLNLLMRLCHEAARRGYDTMDLGCGDEPYKPRFSPGGRRVRSGSLERMGWLMGVRLARRIAKSLLRR
jgi:CelD/BcsL family acetyltransferase involved in cellulose biosynthesis